MLPHFLIEVSAPLPENSRVRGSAALFCHKDSASSCHLFCFTVGKRLCLTSPLIAEYDHAQCTSIVWVLGFDFGNVQVA